jgi:hypothetical protein
MLILRYQALEAQNSSFEKVALGGYGVTKAQTMDTRKRERRNLYGFKEEAMAPLEETKTISCHFSMTKSKSSLVTSQMMNCMFETTVSIVFKRLLALRSLCCSCRSARGKSLDKTYEKLKRIC